MQIPTFFAIKIRCLSMDRPYASYPGIVTSLLQNSAVWELTIFHPTLFSYSITIS